MPKRSSKGDINTTAFSVAQQATDRGVAVNCAKEHAQFPARAIRHELEIFRFYNSNGFAAVHNREVVRATCNGPRKPDHGIIKSFYFAKFGECRGV